MHCIFNGLVASGYEEVPGNLILTPSSVYVLKNGEKPGMGTALFGGVLGAIVGDLIRRKMVEDSPPAFFDDPELAGISAKERRSLSTAEVLVKYDRHSPAFTFTPTGTGFSFNDGLTGARYSGFFNKKKIAEFLAKS